MAMHWQHGPEMVTGERKKERDKEESGVTASLRH